MNWIQDWFGGQGVVIVVWGLVVSELGWCVVGIAVCGAIISHLCDINVQVKERFDLCRALKLGEYRLSTLASFKVILLML